MTIKDFMVHGNRERQAEMSGVEPEGSSVVIFDRPDEGLVDVRLTGGGSEVTVSFNDESWWLMIGEVARRQETTDNDLEEMLNG